MSEVHQIDADFTPVHGIVKFRNSDQTYFMVSTGKGKSNAKVLRQAADMIGTSDERSRNMSEWLNNLAGKFERCEGE